MTCGMFVGRAVREVQAQNVRTRDEERAQNCRIARRRADGRDDFRAFLQYRVPWHLRFVHVRAGSCARLSAVKPRREVRARSPRPALSGAVSGELRSLARYSTRCWRRCSSPCSLSSSQEGATENVEGGEVVTLTRTSPVVVANQPPPRMRRRRFRTSR